MSLGSNFSSVQRSEDVTFFYDSIRSHSLQLSQSPLFSEVELYNGLSSSPIQCATKPEIKPMVVKTS